MERKLTFGDHMAVLATVLICWVIAIFIMVLVLFISCMINPFIHESGWQSFLFMLHDVNPFKHHHHGY